MEKTDVCFEPELNSHISLGVTTDGLFLVVVLPPSALPVLAKLYCLGAGSNISLCSVKLHESKTALLAMKKTKPTKTWQIIVRQTCFRLFKCAEFSIYKKVLTIEDIIHKNLIIIAHNFLE